MRTSYEHREQIQIIVMNSIRSVRIYSLVRIILSADL